ncbi:MAG TPA: hypothetical protein VK730_02200 [Solirubrobacteraceae bacterium]|jgi:hypothetical protein|nr:hypothetical protein [Solirubrobacteraceae bacterium]
MLKIKGPLALVVIGTTFLILTAVANADFVFTKPAKLVTFTKGGETEEVIVENKAAVAEVPKFTEVQKDNLTKMGKQFIGINATKTLKECEIAIASKGTCNFFVEYINERGTEPIPEFRVAVEPPKPCPNMTPEFNAS